MRKTGKDKLSVFGVDLFFVLMCLVTVIPFILLVMISISNEKDIALEGYKLIPKRVDFAAYRYLFNNPTSIVNAYKLTIFVSFAGTFMGLLAMSLIAYPLSVRNFKYRRFISMFVFITMIFNGGTVSSYIINTKYLHMSNNLLVYILPTLVNAWYVIMMRTFFQGIPVEMIEAAEIDGAEQYRILFTMVIPLSKPVLATVGLFDLLTRWNDWYTCMLYITDDTKITLQYLLQRMLQNIELLRQMQSQGVSVSLNVGDIQSETVRMAMAVVVAGPMILVFPFFQKYFSKGLTVGSVKG